MRPGAKVEKIEEALNPYKTNGVWEVNIGGAKINFWATHGIENEEKLQEEISKLGREIINLNFRLTNKDQEISTLKSKIDKIIGMSPEETDLLNDWKQLHKEKEKLEYLLRRMI